MIRNVFIAVALSLSILSPAWGQDFQKGDEAYKRGDYAAAMREWRPLAQKGDANAQFMLGKMYGYGEGVLEDLVYAYM